MAGTAQGSFSTTENCLENTISKTCASAANRADAARAAPASSASPRSPDSSAPCLASSALTHFLLRSPHGLLGTKWELHSFLSFFFFKAVNTSHDWVPIERWWGLDEPRALQELNEHPVHERVLAQCLHQHHPLLPQQLQHSGDVQHLIVFQTGNHDL